MKKINKFRVIGIIYSFFFFLSAIVLTHDYFDDYKNRDNVLMFLLIIQLCLIIYTIIVRGKRRTE